MKCLLQKVFMIYPEPQEIKQSATVPNQGLSYYGVPASIFSFYLKQGVYIMDSIIDAIFIAPLRIMLTIYFYFIDLKGIQKIQLQLDIVHLLFIWTIVALFVNHQYFEIGIWYHIVRGQSQIKLYGILQILDLLDRLACTQGDYIMRQLYWQSVNSSGTVFNRYLIYSFIYILLHSCLLGLQLTVYNVILSQGVHLLYLALFVLSLIKLKGSVFKKQDEKTVLSMVINDGREFVQKVFYIILISICVKFTPVDFYYKIGFYFLVDIIVDSFKYISLFHLNNIDIELVWKYSKELSNFTYAVTVQKQEIYSNLNGIDAKDMAYVLQTVPHATLKTIGKFQFVIFPQVVILLRMLAYWHGKHYQRLSKGDYLLIFIIMFLLLLIVKLLVHYYQHSCRLRQCVAEQQFKQQ